jgi:hypothetical protein
MVNGRLTAWTKGDRFTHAMLIFLPYTLGRSGSGKETMDTARKFLRVFATAFALAATSQGFAAEGGVWSVSKSSGEVWITSGGVQQASLKPEDNLNPGDTIRTGRTGRVFLIRDEESILIAPNSVVALPAEMKEGLSTTIVQRAGSILLEVEKRNVKHFEVETPYLAAVVKGTRFRVSVNATSTSVDVIRGQVEVADFKSGQIVKVMPGQRATAFEHGKPGLSLSGTGIFNPIEQSEPRPSSVDRIPVPKAGLSAPRNAANGQAIRALAAIDRTGGRGALQPRYPGGMRSEGLRISSALGEVKLDVHKVTHGLARGSTAATVISRDTANNAVWNSSSTTSPNASSSATSGASTSLSSASQGAAAVAAATNSGSGNGKGNGNGNGANGNGNGGVGNGKGNGNSKH